MSKIDEVRADMVKAMKAKDKDTKETLSMLLAALKNKAIDKREDLTDFDRGVSYDARRSSRHAGRRTKSIYSHRIGKIHPIRRADQ